MFLFGRNDGLLYKYNQLHICFLTLCTRFAKRSLTFSIFRKNRVCRLTERVFYNDALYVDQLHAVSQLKACFTLMIVMPSFSAATTHPMFSGFELIFMEEAELPDRKDLVSVCSCVDAAVLQVLTTSNTNWPVCCFLSWCFLSEPCCCFCSLQTIGSPHRSRCLRVCRPMSLHVLFL